MYLWKKQNEQNGKIHDTFVKRFCVLLQILKTLQGKSQNKEWT